jgi:membrane associated rhomboid family serine protease
MSIYDFYKKFAFYLMQGFVVSGFVFSLFGALKDAPSIVVTFSVFTIISLYFLFYSLLEENLRSVDINVIVVTLFSGIFVQVLLILINWYSNWFTFLLFVVSGVFYLYCKFKKDLPDFKTIWSV